MFAEPVALGSDQICEKHSMCRCHLAVYSQYTCISVINIHCAGVTLQFLAHHVTTIKIMLHGTYIYIVPSQHLVVHDKQYTSILINHFLTTDIKFVILIDDTSLKASIYTVLTFSIVHNYYLTHN